VRVTVTRYDAARLGNVRKTSQGFLRAPARVTRTGVLTYHRADGSVVRELRRPDNVFAADSLATLADAPVTDLHPRDMLSPSNAKQLAVGHVSGASARADAGRFVEAQLVITDAAMITAIEAGDRSEVSCGYTCDLKHGAGVFNGEHYDAEQTNIVYNHVGIGPRNWGRAGSEVALRLDSKTPDDFALGEGAARAVLTDEPKRDSNMDLVTIRIDGIEAQVTPTTAQILQRTLDTRDTAARDAAAKLTDLQKRYDAQQAELDATKTQLAQAADPKRFDAALRDRLELLDRARPVLGRDAKLDGKSPRDIKELALEKMKAGGKLSERSDAYVDALFDMTVDKWLADNKVNNHRSTDPAPHHDGGNGSDVDVHAILDGRRADGTQPLKREYQSPPWRSKLASTRTE
jgi:hypothetical protein